MPYSDSSSCSEPEDEILLTFDESATNLEGGEFMTVQDNKSAAGNKSMLGSSFKAQGDNEMPKVHRLASTVLPSPKNDKKLLP